MTPIHIDKLFKPFLLTLLLGVGTLEQACAAVPVPVVSMPPADGIPFDSKAQALSQAGYIEQEFFISGTAQAFTDEGALSNNGKWIAKPNPGVTASYVTRLLVRRPANPERFNGTVVVEWYNVSGGIDAAPDYLWMAPELLREGYAWVGVSAQYVGAAALKQFDGTHYAAISHPGDSWSYDIFSQVAQAIRAGNIKPLGPLTSSIKALLADGESQSAMRMFTYYNAIHPLAKLYNGFLIHSTGLGAPLSQSYAGGLVGVQTIPAPAGVPATPDIPVPPTALIRADLRQPVMFVNTETDITFPALAAVNTVHTQADSAIFRMWELAGTAHGDQVVAGGFDCGDPPINDGPQRFSMRAAVHGLNQWIRYGIYPPIGARLETASVVTPQGTLQVIARDPATGIALGGIRLPPVSVPVATLTGERPVAALQSNPFCALFGATDPWNGNSDSWDGQAGYDPSPTPEPVLGTLYGSKKNYVWKFMTATWNAVEAQFVRPKDVEELYALAIGASF